MTIAFNCSECSAPLKVADTLAGKKCKCPKCATVNPVPNGEEEAIQETPSAKKAKSSVATESAKPTKKMKADEEEDTSDAAEDESKVKKGKKPKGKKRSKGMLIGGIIGLLGVAFLACAGCGGGGFALWYFWPGTPSELKYMPTGTTSITSHRVDQERNSKYYKDVEAAKPAMFKNNDIDIYQKMYGVSSTNIDRIVTGGSGTGNDQVTVVTAKAAVNSMDIIGKVMGNAKTEFEEEKVGSYTMQKPKSQVGLMAFCIVDGKEGKTIVYSNDPKILKAVLERNKAPEFSPAMQSALNKADFSKTEVKISVGDKKDLMPDRIGDKKSPKAEFMIMEQDLGTDMKMRLVASFKDANDATEAKKLMDDVIQKEKADLEKKGLLGELTVSNTVSGTVLTIESRETSKVQIKNFEGKR